MQPPTPGRDLGLVASIIAANPGQTIQELALSSGLWTHELASITRALHSQGLIEARGSRLFVRQRRKKTAAPPLFWSRLLAVFRGN
jgi:hypothetical protein